MTEWYDNFIETLRKLYPKKADLAEALMDLLALEKESVYRRLRKQIIFPAHEIAKIAYTWGISMDEILGTDSHRVMFQMHLLNFSKPSKEMMSLLRKSLQVLEYLRDSPQSEFILVCNSLLRSLSTGFPDLYKFNVFKWAYEYGNSIDNNPATTYADTVLAGELLKEATNYSRTMKKVTNTTYILDSMIFDFAVREIRYYHSIFLISDEDKQKLKAALLSLLDYLLQVANTGCFPETGNKVQLYISMLNINTNYSYFCVGDAVSCRVHAFSVYDIFSYNCDIAEDFRVWLQKKKRASILISEADTRSRIEFFMRQREIIEGL